MMKIRKSVWKTSVIFSFFSFLVFAFTMILIICLMSLLFHFGIVDMRNPILLFSIFAIASIIVGTSLSILMAKHMITPIIDISNATKKVANNVNP